MGQTPGLDFITRLNPVQYKLKVGGYDVALIEGTEPPEYNKTVIPGARVHYGFLAQEVKSVVDDLQLDDFAGWVSSDVGNPDAMQSLRYEEFIAPTIKALQEAMARIETLEAQVAALQSSAV